MDKPQLPVARWRFLPFPDFRTVKPGQGRIAAFMVKLHELWQQADALPDEEQRALIMVIDSFVTKVNVEKAVKKSVRQR